MITGSRIHVAATFDDATNTAQIYINGSPNATNSVTNALVATAQPIRIGWGAQSGQFFDGLLDDVRIYNSVLSPAEISALAATPPSDCRWWDANYGYRAQITVSAGSSAIAANYPTRFTFNHAGLVSGGKSLANGNDARILYWNGSSWTELSRALFDDGPASQPSSSWNVATSTVFFKTVASIPSSGSDTGYYLYYGNPLASSPPTNTPSARYYVAENLTETQTSSTSYASHLQLLFTPSAATEHWVVVATWRQREVGNIGVESDLGLARIRINGATRAGTDAIGYRQSGDAWTSKSAFFKITGTTASQTINLDFRADGGTDGIDRARIVAFVIPDPSSANIQYAETLATVTDAVNPTNSQTLTFTPASAGDYVWMANGFFVEGPGGTTTGGLAAVDPSGTPQQSSEESYLSAGSDYVSLTHFERRTLAASSQTFTIRHQPDTGLGSERRGLTQLLFRADVFEAVEASSSVGNSQTSSTSYVLKNSFTTAAPSARDYVYLAVMMVDDDGVSGSLTVSTYGEIRLGGTVMVEDDSAINRSSYNHQIAWAYAENISGGRIIENRYRAESPATAESQYAHILGLRYKEPGTSLGAEE